MPASPNDPNELHSRLDPDDFNTMDMEAAPKTPSQPLPKASDYLDDGPGTMPLPSADPSDTPYTLPLPSVGDTGTEQKPSGQFKALSGVHPKAAPTPPPMPSAAPPTPRLNQKVVIAAEHEKPIRRGKGLLPILIGLMQFSCGLLLIGLLLASVAPMMAGYDGPIGGWGARIQEWVRPYAIDLCEVAPISGCFGYGDPIPLPTDEPESSHQNMPGLCHSPCDPDAVTSTCAEELACIRDATGAGYCYSATSPLCEVTATPSTNTQTTTGGSNTGGTTGGDQPAGIQTDDPCKDHGGVADINPAFCSCQSITYTVITCQDGSKIETANAGSACNPDPANCQPAATTDGGTQTGGGDTSGTTGGGTTSCEFVCYVKDRTGKCTQGGWVYPGTDKVCDPRNP